MLLEVFNNEQVIKTHTFKFCAIKTNGYLDGTIFEYITRSYKIFSSYTRKHAQKSNFGIKVIYDQVSNKSSKIIKKTF